MAGDITEFEVDGVHARVRFEKGGYWATVDEHSGVFVTGDTLEELGARLREGIALAASGLIDEQTEIRRRDTRLRERLKKLREEERQLYDLLGGETNARGTRRESQTPWSVIRARMFLAQIGDLLQQPDPDWVLIRKSVEELREVVDEKWSSS